MVYVFLNQSKRVRLTLSSDVRSSITRGIASSGYFVVSANYIGFWTKIFSLSDTTYRYEVGKVKGARAIYRYRIRTFGMALDLKEHRSMHFDFSSQERRDEAIERVMKAVSAYRLRLRKSREALSSSFSTTALRGSESPRSPPPLPMSPNGRLAFT